jgi:hypothetical protein
LNHVPVTKPPIRWLSTYRYVTNGHAHCCCGGHGSYCRYITEDRWIPVNGTKPVLYLPQIVEPLILLAIPNSGSVLSELAARLIRKMRKHKKHTHTDKYSGCLPRWALSSLQLPMSKHGARVPLRQLREPLLRNSARQHPPRQLQQNLQHGRPSRAAARCCHPRPRRDTPTASPDRAMVRRLRAQGPAAPATWQLPLSLLPQLPLELQPSPAIAAMDYRMKCGANHAARLHRRCCRPSSPRLDCSELRSGPLPAVARWYLPPAHISFIDISFIDISYIIYHLCRELRDGTCHPRIYHLLIHHLCRQLRAGAHAYIIY